MKKNPEEKPKKSLLKRLVNLFLFIGFILIVLVALGFLLEKNELPSFCAKFGASCKNQADAIVVISGGNTEHRTKKGVELLKQGFSDKIIFSGANSNPNIVSDASRMSKIAQKLGVAENQIILDENAQNTEQNAKFVSEIIKKNNFKSVILVTSGYHQKRAELEFENQLKNQAEIISTPANNDPDWDFWWWTRPRGWYLAMSEFAGIIKFYLRNLQNG